MDALRIRIPGAKPSNMYVSPPPNVSLGGVSVTPSPTGTSLLTPSPMGNLNKGFRNGPVNVNERVSFPPMQSRIRRGGTKKRKNKSKSKSRKNRK
jgi:hypothetical protein